MKSNGQMAGYYRCVVRNADGSTKRDYGWHSNVLLNQGRDFPGKYDQFLAYCHVGLGNTPAQVTDANLETFEVSTAAAGAGVPTAQSTPPYYGAMTFLYTFDGADIIGAHTIKEVGTGRLVTNTGLFSRMVLPEAIVMLVDEVLDVYYELRIYPDHLTTTSTTITISSIVYAIDIRACNVTSSAHWGAGIGDKFLARPAVDWLCWAGGAAIGPVTGQPSGVEIAGGGDGTTNSEYADGSFQSTAQISYGSPRGNHASHFAACMVNVSSGVYQIVFDPPIPKSAAERLILEWTHSWSRKTL